MANTLVRVLSRMWERDSLNYSKFEGFNVKFYEKITSVETIQSSYSLIPYCR